MRTIQMTYRTDDYRVVYEDVYYKRRIDELFQTD